MDAGLAGDKLERRTFGASQDHGLQLLEPNGIGGLRVQLKFENEFNGYPYTIAARGG